MKEMNEADFRQLKHGDRVSVFRNGQFRNLRFVGTMPGHEDYFIFCDGEYLEHKFIGTHTSLNGWYSGESDSQFKDAMKIAYHQALIDSIKNKN